MEKNVIKMQNFGNFAPQTYAVQKVLDMTDEAYKETYEAFRNTLAELSDYLKNYKTEDKEIKKNIDKFSKIYLELSSLDPKDPLYLFKIKKDVFGIDHETRSKDAYLYLDADINWPGLPFDINVGISYIRVFLESHFTKVLYYKYINFIEEMGSNWAGDCLYPQQKIGRNFDGE